MKKTGGKKILEIIMLLVWVFVSFLASRFVFGLLFSIFVSAESTAINTVYNILVYAATLTLIFVVPPKLFHKWQTSTNEVGTEGSLTWADLGLAPVGFIVYFLLSAALTNLLSSLPFFDASSAQDVGYNILLPGVDRIMGFAMLVVIAPIVEEIIFRGWLYGKLRAKITGKLSILASSLLVSLLFALFHQNFAVGVDVFALSMVSCVLREITGTVYSGIVMHMLKNALAFYLVYIAGIS